MTSRDQPCRALLPNLETFALAAELCSFTATAKRLGLTQAAVSQRIHSLEKDLGVALFDRNRRGIMLTEAGRTLYDYTQRIFELHASARQALLGTEPSPGGELVLAASSIPGEHLLPAILPEFQKSFPQIQVRAGVSDSDRVLYQVERGEASLGLVGRKADRRHLSYHFLARDRMLLVIPPAHPLARRRSVAVDHIRPFPLILREAGSGLRHCFEHSLERLGKSLEDFHVALELGSNEAIKKAVRRGVGLAILSVYAVRAELETGELLGRPIRDLHCDREMYVISDRRRVLPWPARTFLFFLESHPIADLEG